MLKQNTSQYFEKSAVYVLTLDNKGLEFRLNILILYQPIINGILEFLEFIYTHTQMDTKREKKRLYFRTVLGSQQTEGKVQRFSIYGPHV